MPMPPPSPLCPPPALAAMPPPSPSAKPEPHAQEFCLTSAFAQSRYWI